MDVTFTGPGGGNPAEHILRMTRAALVTEGDLMYGLQLERTRILRRTAAGTDAQGSRFAQYSPAYAKQKQKYGRGVTVDLRGRNAPNMLQAMIATAGSLTDGGDSLQPARTGALEFYDDRSAMLARVHNEGEGRQPRRHFFDATNDIPYMEQDVGRHVDARLRAFAT
jgi:hypothetical protein